MSDSEHELRWQRAMKTVLAGFAAPALPAETKALLLAQARQASRRKSARLWRAWFGELWRPRRAAGFGLAAGLAAAVVVVLLKTGDGPTETIALNDMLAEHRAYVLTMPLADHETVLSGLTDALAGRRP